MDGVVITIILLCIIAAGLGTFYIAMELYKLDRQTEMMEMMERRTPEREVYDADWNRIMQDTLLERKGGKKK